MRVPEKKILGEWAGLVKVSSLPAPPSSPAPRFMGEMLPSCVHLSQRHPSGSQRAIELMAGAPGQRLC